MSHHVNPFPVRRMQAGFTMVELIVVMILAGVLAAFAIPKIDAALNVRDDAWRDALVSALRVGQKTAASHRRLVCVNVDFDAVTVRIASANPATVCDKDMLGPEGGVLFAHASNANAHTTVAPTGTIFFQPDGRVTTDGAGAFAQDRTISAAGVSNIVLRGETGYVD